MHSTSHVSTLSIKNKLPCPQIVSCSSSDISLVVVVITVVVVRRIVNMVAACGCVCRCVCLLMIT